MFFKKYLKYFFISNFYIRFLIWIFGNFLFIFGLAFIIASNSGFSTYDAFFQPIRMFLGVSPSNYGKFILIPAGIIFCIIGFVIHYIRTKKIKINYLLSIFYIFIIAFLLDQVLKIKFINNMLNKTKNLDWPFISYPQLIITLIIGIFIFTIGIGIITGCDILPNNYALLVEEISLSTNKSFKIIQFIFDVFLIIAGLLITILNIYILNKISWYKIFHVIGLGTIIILLIESYVIHFSIIKTRQLINKINKNFPK